MPAARQSRLEEILRQRITAGGPIPFREFMASALYDPDHGYYSSGGVEIGRRGDYFTSVSVGPVFGELLAGQIGHVWRALGGPAPFTLVEQGAHDGSLAGDILNAIRQSNPGLFASLEYVVVEPHARLRALQEDRLALIPGANPRWVPTLDALGAKIPAGVHFSNELLDAMPVHLVQSERGRWREVHVSLDRGRLAFATGPLSSPELDDYVRTHLPDRPDGYRTEVNLECLRWVREAASLFSTGLILIADYGFPRDVLHAPERTAGTLRTYSGHRMGTDPLATPGAIDLTAHVDFTAVAESAIAAGLRIEGFADQHHFLVGAAEEWLLAIEKSGDVSAHAGKIRAFKTLMHPGTMGMAFHFLGLRVGRESPFDLPGFAHARGAGLALIASP